MSPSRGVVPVPVATDNVLAPHLEWREVGADTRLGTADDLPDEVRELPDDAPRRHPYAAIVLALGALGVVGLFPAGLIAIPLALRVLRDLASGRFQRGRGPAIAGLVLGVLSIAWLVPLWRAVLG